MFPIKVFLLLTALHTVHSYVPGELCTEEDIVRKRCIKWVSTPKNDVLYSYVQTSKAATCAIHKTTSRLHCWGGDAESTFMPNEMEIQYKDIALGYRHICGLDKRTHFLKCWGRGDASVVPPHLTATEFDTVSAGPYDTCATMLKNNSAICFGKHDMVPPQPTKFVAVVVPDGELSPAGEGYSVLEHFVRTYKKITIGRHFACGIVKGDGGYSDGNENQREHTMDCWAGTTELDVGANVISTTIIEKDRPAPSMKFKDLAAGPTFICGIGLNDEQLYCWGKRPRGVPLTSPGPFRSLRVAEKHVCALKKDHTHDRIGLKGSGGSLQCWGYNSDGQTDAPNMAQFNGNLKWQFLQVDVGHRHSCALRYDHKIFCWGNSLAYSGMVGPDKTIEERIEFY